jgi:predicted transcriptional regulator
MKYNQNVLFVPNWIEILRKFYDYSSVHTTKDVYRRVNMCYGALYKNMKLLEKNGFLRLIKAYDKRQTNVYELTDEGRALIELVVYHKKFKDLLQDQKESLGSKLYKEMAGLVAEPEPNPVVSLEVPEAQESQEILPGANQDPVIDPITDYLKRIKDRNNPSS